MKPFIASMLPILLSTAHVAGAQATSADGSAKQAQTIMRAGSQAPSKGAAEYFTGNVRVSSLFPAHPSTPVSGHSFSFERGARSAWHTPPAGQHLIVTAGAGWKQEWALPVAKEVFEKRPR